MRVWQNENKSRTYPHNSRIGSVIYVPSTYKYYDNYYAKAKAYRDSLVVKGNESAHIPSGKPTMKSRANKNNRKYCSSRNGYGSVQ